MDEDIEYTSTFTVTINYPDGTIKHLNRKEAMQLIHIIHTPPNYVSEAILAARVQEMISINDVLSKQIKEENNTKKVNFKLVLRDNTKDE